MRVYLLEYSSLHGIWIGAWDVVSVLRSLAISAGLMGLTPRRHSPANSYFSTKDNTFGVGLNSRDHQQSSRAQGASGSPDHIWPIETRVLGVEKGQRCFAEQRCMSTAFCSPRSVEVLRSLAGSGGIAGACARRHFPANSCLSTKEKTFGVGLKLSRPPAKQQGPGGQRQPRPSLA